MQNANSINTDHTDHFTLQNDLWTDGLICAFEFVGAGCKKLVQTSTAQFSTKDQDLESGVNVMFGDKDCTFHGKFCKELGVQRRGCCWVPIGWTRISELVQTVQVADVWPQQAKDSDEEDCVAVADVTWRPLIGNRRWGPSGGATWLLGIRSSIHG